MARYLCSEVVNNVCSEWVEYESLFDLPEGAGLEVGGALFLLFSSAWGIQQIARFILNR